MKMLTIDVKASWENKIPYTFLRNPRRIVTWDWATFDPYIKSSTMDWLEPPSWWIRRSCIISNSLNIFLDNLFWNFCDSPKINKIKKIKNESIFIYDLNIIKLGNYDYFYKAILFILFIFILIEIKIFFFNYIPKKGSFQWQFVFFQKKFNI